jgi:serine protease Do
MMRNDFLRPACLLAVLLAAPATPQAAEKERPPKPPKPATTANIFLQSGGGSYLGVGVLDIDAERAKAIKLNEERGVEVKNVDDDSPAAKAGLKPGDVVLEFNGQRVESGEQFARLVRETPAGRQAKLLILREGKNQTVTAAIGTRPGQFIARGPDGFRFNFPNPPAPPAPPDWGGRGKWWGAMPDLPSGTMSWRSGMLGIETEGLGSQLAQFFGVKEGVLVRSVNKNSPAEKAGLKAGDVIIKVSDSAVDSPDDLSRQVRAVRGKGRVVLTVVRERKETTVTVELEDDAQNRGIAFVQMFC